MSYGFLPNYLKHPLKIALALVSLVVGGDAFAQSQAAQVRAARKACLNGDYTKGVSILTELFIDTKNPTHIYNQGRCFEQSRRFADAVSRFEEYLRVTEGKLKKDEREATEKHLKDCQDQLAKEQAAFQPPPPDLTTPPNDSPEPKPVVDTPDPRPEPKIEAEAEPVRRKPRWGLVTAGIISGVAGVGGVVTGIVFQSKANKAISDMEGKLDAFSASKQNNQEGYKTASIVGYAAGTAFIAAGAIMLGFGLKTTPSSPSNLAFVPAIGPGQVGASLSGGF